MKVGWHLPVFMAGATLLGSLWFLVGMEETLHCTQKTSLAIATFDMRAHPEEGHEPLVFGSPCAVPLRVLLSGSLAGLLLFPAIGVLLVVRRSLPLRRWIQVTAGLLALVVVNALLPESVVGERYRYLLRLAALLGIAPLLGLAGSLLLWRRSQGPTRGSSSGRNSPIRANLPAERAERHQPRGHEEGLGAGNDPHGHEQDAQHGSPHRNA